VEKRIPFLSETLSRGNPNEEYINLVVEISYNKSVLEMS